MRKNRSPWLHQLDKDRKHTALKGDIQADIAIVGAGIAGIATAFFTLKYTDKKVVVLEGYRLAHGATGHNAGQVVSYFEKGLVSMVKEFGMDLAVDGQRSIDDTWTLLYEMYNDAKLDIFIDRRIGYEGFSTYEQLVDVLEEMHVKREAGLRWDRVTVATTAPFMDIIPSRYVGLWSAAPHAHVLEMLETDNPVFLIAASLMKGCINSALFCEKMADYLAEQYKDRFALFEHTPVHKVILRDGHALLDGEHHTIEAQRVILCTNGFESLHIINENGLDVDAKYHALLRGRIAYMSAYLEDAGKPPAAITYLTPDEPSENLPYYYLTRRPYEYEEGREHSLISIGGPEEALEKNAYSRDVEYPERAIGVIDNFVKTIYDAGRKGPVEYEFTWHGLMGYTANGIRMIGPEPKNPVLLYNLGCNGVGILPSVFGGRKIARHLAGEDVPKSIFDIPVRVPSELPLGSPKLHV